MILFVVVLAIVATIVFAAAKIIVEIRKDRRDRK